VEIEFTNLLGVVAVAFAAPLLLGLAPALRVPAVVLEIVAGIAIGPSGLGWVSVDQPVEVLSLVGLAFLLFLAGLEIDPEKLRGRVARLAAAGFALSFVIALAAGIALGVDNALFVGIVLSGTSLGVVVPVLKDAGRSGSTFGQLVIAAASVADFATIVLLSLLFSREATSTTTKVLLLGGLVLVVVLVVLAVAGVEHSHRLRRTLARLQDTTAQIRVRGAFLLLIGFVALATQLGLEVILGAFLAGAALTLVDRDEAMTHPLLRAKLEAVGFGVFVPVFFVASGLRFDLDALGDPSTLMRVPLFLGALLAARGLPALLYRGLVDRREVVVAALLQATSLPFIVAATAIGTDLGVVSSADAAAMVAAGLASVVLFPAGALGLLGRGPEGGPEAATGAASTAAMG
jgi:Kef-type K+ transport system membrane component KefB